MHKKTHSGMLLTLLLIGMLTLAFTIQPVKGEWTGTVYIRANGSIDPADAPISTVDDVTYTLTGNITSDADGIVIERNNMQLDGAGYTLQGIGRMRGIDLSGRTNVTVRNTHVKSFYWGIYVWGSSNNTISGNNITANDDSGIYLYHSSNNNCISGNRITANDDNGIRLYESSNNSISGNNITANYDFGVWLGYSSSNSVSGNTITANDLYGISLSDSLQNSISGNNITANNVYGIYLRFSSNNSVNGNNIANNSYAGIEFWGSSNNSISGNDVTDNVFGIELDESSYNSISINKIANNDHGIFLLFSSNCNGITGNDVTNNVRGILFLRQSSNNSVSGNDVTNNVFGIILDRSSNNIMYHNNFIDNSQQAYSYASANVWDDGYPSGGNYWSDYEDRYPDAGEIDDSGIWDTPYEIDEDNQDNYPLMEPWTPLPRTIAELKTEIEKLCAEDEIDNHGIITSLLAKLDAAQKLIDEGKIDQAKTILNAFINEVQAQLGKHITPEAADILIESAEYILSHL